MIKTSNLGYPRFGAKRELKRALESYWSEQSTAEQLQMQMRELRLANWKLQQQAGLDFIPSNDFSLYDQVLDTAVMVGAIPARYGWTGGAVDLSTYFAMARGIQRDRLDIPAMEMTKWFDTNYHYIVPEFESGMRFQVGSTKIVDEFLEAEAQEIHTRPVLLGPISFLLLGKTSDEQRSSLDLLEALLPIYAETLMRLQQAGADWVQIDEPCLVLDLAHDTLAAYQRAYTALRAATPDLKFMLTTYFGSLRENLSFVRSLPINGLHLDSVRAPEQLEAALNDWPADKILSLGVIDGRNVWRTDLDRVSNVIQQARQTLPDEQIILSPSCSLLHCPIDLELETALDPKLKSWMAFANQKLTELEILKQVANQTLSAANEEKLTVSRAALASRQHSARVHNPEVQERLRHVTAAQYRRNNPYEQRRIAQEKQLNLPILPTTTIGSFPQTPEIRQQRAAFKAGRISEAQYETFLKAEIERTVRLQEEIGLDVLVHGESERTDMVEYFGEQLTGIAFTEHGWVQSYGSRGVRPPIIFGDVSRPQPMTVRWSVYAQSLTQKPMKGMLTGPITILEWSFVRDDQPRSETCRQIGLALRDEVNDLETAGITVIQIDEPALREGLPLHRDQWDEYLRWTVECFQLCAAGVRDETQIHTHMCYAEFNDILGAIAALDADVISIETSRSRMELLHGFGQQHYPNSVGPGVYDIHSPRVPSRQEVDDLLQKALEVLSPNQLWVNPDCGLKTRRWEEVLPALRIMVESASGLREKLRGVLVP